MKKFIKTIYRRATVHIDEDARYGLNQAARMIKKNTRPLLAMLTTGLGAAFFEGGTIGILGLAVSVVVGEKNPMLFSVFESIDRVFGINLVSISVGVLFVALVLLAILAQVLKSGLIYLNDVSQIVLTLIIRRNFQKEITERVMAMSYEDISVHPAGAVAAYIEQSAIFSETVPMLNNIFRAVTMSAAYMVILVWMSPFLAFTTVAIVVVIWWSLNFVVRKLRNLAQIAARARVTSSRWTIEYLNAPRLIRIFDAASRVEKVINDARDNYLLPDRRAQIIYAAVKPAVEVITIAGAGLFLAFGYLVSGVDTISVVPKLLVFVLVFWRMRPQLIAMNDFRLKFYRLVPSVSIVVGFLNQAIKSERKRVRNYKDREKFIRLRENICYSDVCFRYPGTERRVLIDISLSIRRGQTIALVGESGAGKTTLCDLLLGLYSATSGSIEIDGQSLNSLDLGSWRRKLGVVDQDVFLLNTTIKENITFGRSDVDWNEIEVAAKVANAHDFIKELKDGYDTIIGDRGFQLSGGQQQRLALARALMGNPEILILDEATSALDSVSEKLIQTTLEELHQTRTMLVVAHRLSTVKRADHIVVLHRGEIIEQGSWSELLENNSTFSRMWKLQVGGNL